MWEGFEGIGLEPVLKVSKNFPKMSQGQENLLVVGSGLGKGEGCRKV